jgi:hypothetical protein
MIAYFVRRGRPRALRVPVRGPQVEWGRSSAFVLRGYAVDSGCWGGSRTAPTGCGDE